MNFKGASIIFILCLGILASSFSFLPNKEEISIPAKKVRKPNVVIIFLDDSGYSDFSPFGNGNIPTPNVQKLADEGTRFTNFYVPQAICSASRSALITGCYPGRTKVFGAHGPKERGLETNFPTIGELFKSEGYKTALFGKMALW